MLTNDSEGLIMAIDPGTNTMGVAMIRFRFKDLSIVSVEATTYVGERLRGGSDDFGLIHGDRYLRLRRHLENLSKLMTQHQPTIVASETAFYGRSKPNAYQALVETIFVIKQALWSYNEDLPLMTYDPRTVKNALNAKGTKKEDMLKAIKEVKEIMDKIERFEDMDEHSIDAIAVGYAALNEYRKSRYVKKYQLKDRFCLYCGSWSIGRWDYL